MMNILFKKKIGIQKIEIEDVTIILYHLDIVLLLQKRKMLQKCLPCV